MKMKISKREKRNLRGKTLTLNIVHSAKFDWSPILCASIPALFEIVKELVQFWVGHN